MIGRTVLLAGFVLACSFAAHAAEVSLAPSAALGCLTPAAEQRPKIVYPAHLLERKDGGTVSVELEFTAGDRAPKVKLLSEKVFHAELIDTVFDHVAMFRVPCMGAGDPPVKLRQDYVFIANDGRKVMSSQPRDMADGARMNVFDCLKQPAAEQVVGYTEAMRRQEVEGNVYVQLRFNGPDAEPEVTVLASSHRLLERAMRDHAKQLRLPCVTGEAATGRVIFKYRLEGGRRTLLRDLTLPRFLAAVSPPVPAAYFDFTTMGCPFDLRLTYFQPHGRNVIGELESTNAARGPFIDWLAGLPLRLSDRDNTAVLGDTMTVSVPCGKLDL